MGLQAPRAQRGADQPDDPAGSVARLGLARSLEAMGKTAEALDEYRRLATRDPSLKPVVARLMIRRNLELPPAQRLMSVIGVIRGAVSGVAVSGVAVSGVAVSGVAVPCAVVRAGPDVQAGTAARVRASSATADAVDRNGRMRIYRPFWPAWRGPPTRG